MDLALGLRRGGESIGSFAARGSVEYSADGSNHFFRFELLSQRPGNFQFTVLDPLGRPAMRVISDGSRFVALQYGAREATVGPADPGSLGRFLPLGLRAEDFISLLSGTLVPVPEAAALDPGPRNGQTLRILPGGFWSGASWKVSLSSAENGQRIDGFTATMADGPPLVAGYGQFAVLPVEDAGLRVDFPHRLDLSWGREKKLLIRYDEVRLGFPAQPGMFLPLVPAGFSRVEL
jgi:hypothetical protein